MYHPLFLLSWLQTATPEAAVPETPVPEAQQPAPDDARETDDDAFIEQPPTPEQGVQMRSRLLRPGREPVYGPILLSAGLGFSRQHFGIGIGATGFPNPYIGFGVNIQDSMVFYDTGQYNDFVLTPHVMVIALPFFRVTPYLHGAIGGEFVSNGLGSYGRWEAGSGLILRLGERQRIALRVGATVIGRIPDDRWATHFHCLLTTEVCSLAVVPEIGVGLRLGK